MAKRLIKYMFFQNEKNLMNLGSNSDPIIAGFLPFMKRYRKEVFLYLEDPMVEKTSDIAEQHFPIQSWLFKHRFKTKEGLLRASS